MPSLPPANQLPAAAKRDGRGAQSGAVAAQFGVPARPILGFDHDLALCTITRRPLPVGGPEPKISQFAVGLCGVCRFSAASPRESVHAACRGHGIHAAVSTPPGAVRAAKQQGQGIRRSRAGPQHYRRLEPRPSRTLPLSDSDNATWRPARYRYRRKGVGSGPAILPRRKRA